MTSARLRVVGGVTAAMLVVISQRASFSQSVSAQRLTAVAVFPIQNLTDDAIPADAVRQFLVDTLVADGVRVLEPGDLEAFMARHRVRYSAGIDEATAGWLREETGAEAVVIASVEFSSVAVPPKFALVTRLISITGTPVVVWAEDVGLSGDDTPGLFDLGLIDDYDVLLARAFERIGRSLTAYIQTSQAGIRQKLASKFRPKSAYRGLTLEPGRSYSVAVVPFFNLTERRNAGEILALHFIRHLSSLKPFRVLDTGVARGQLLNARIIMDGGLSVTDADTVADLIEADFILAGRVLRYEDYEGPEGRTSVEFSAMLIERQSRTVVWSSHSYNEGRDGVRFFERGVSKTAHAMATQMVGLTTEAIVGRYW